MNSVEHENPINAPQFIREREAWFKAGANAMAGYLFLAVIPLAVAVGLVSMIFEFDAYTAAGAMMGGTWILIAIIGFYLGVKARQTALRGGGAN